MHHYRSFSSHQLAEDEYFQRWVKADGSDAELEASWRSWISSNPDHADVVEEARNILLLVYHDRQYLPDETIKQRTWNRIDETLKREPHVSKQDDAVPNNANNNTSLTSREVPAWFKWAAAAVVLTTNSIALYYWNISPVATPVSVSESKHQVAIRTLVATANSQSVTVSLQDGSSVVLQPHSQLSYPEHFAPYDRKVTLVGEGFFEVSKDKARPFFVETSHITTRGLGTSFSVSVFPDDKGATVRVKTGNVSVFRHHAEAVDSAEVLLAPSQQVTYSVSDEKLTKSNVQDKAPLPAVAQFNFEFQDAPLRDVFEMMKAAYHVEFNYREETFSQCLLNASLDDVPF